MGTIRNSTVIQNAQNQLGTQTGSQPLPSKFADVVVPVVDITPRNHRISNFIIHNAGSNTASTSIGQCPADQDTYITAANLGVIKDVTSTSTMTWIECTVGGKALRILQIPGITLTVQNDTLSCTFPTPIKIDRNSSMFVKSSTNVANIQHSACVQGYSVSGSEI